MQGAGVGGHDDPLDPLIRQPPGGLMRLSVSEVGQLGIDDAGIGRVALKCRLNSLCRGAAGSCPRHISLAARGTVGVAGWLRIIQTGAA